MIEYAFKNDSVLSNYYPDSPLVLPNGLQFRNSEAAYHSQKFSDLSWKRMFCTLDPHESKVFAWEHIDLWKEDFFDDKVAYDAMAEVIECKFTQNSKLMKVLLETPGSRIVEDTTGWHDMRWGRCSCPQCFGKPYHNYLGRILTSVRDEHRLLKVSLQK